MPSNSCGVPKTARPVYGQGSGGLNLSEFTGDEEFEDPIKSLRWAIFSRENSGKIDSKEMRSAFCNYFGYKDIK